MFEKNRHDISPHKNNLYSNHFLQTTMMYASYFQVLFPIHFKNTDATYAFQSTAHMIPWTYLSVVMIRGLFHPNMPFLNGKVSPYDFTNHMAHNHLVFWSSK